MLIEFIVLGLMVFGSAAILLYFTVPRKPVVLPPEDTAEECAATDPVLRRFHIRTKWVYADPADVATQLEPYRDAFPDLDSLLSCFDHPEWFDREASERLIEDGELELLYDSLEPVPEESAVQYRTFSRLGRGADRCRRMARYTVLRVRR
jgi:hypothetical protein